MTTVACSWSWDKITAKMTGWLCFGGKLQVKGHPTNALELLKQIRCAQMANGLHLSVTSPVSLSPCVVAVPPPSRFLGPKHAGLGSAANVAHLHSPVPSSSPSSICNLDSRVCTNLAVWHYYWYIKKIIGETFMYIFLRIKHMFGSMDELGWVGSNHFLRMLGWSVSKRNIFQRSASFKLQKMVDQSTSFFSLTREPHPPI